MCISIFVNQKYKELLDNFLGFLNWRNNMFPQFIMENSYI